jgi:hypothetical protein
VACSKANIKSFTAPWQRCRDLEVIEADAAQYDFPPTPLVVFFYNPFSQDVFREVLGNLRRSLAANPRPCFVIYGSSSHNAIDWAAPAIREGGAFEQMRSEAAPFFFDAVRTIRFAVFRNVAG